MCGDDWLTELTHSQQGWWVDQNTKKESGGRRREETNVRSQGESWFDHLNCRKTRLAVAGLGGCLAMDVLF